VADEAKGRHYGRVGDALLSTHSSQFAITTKQGLLDSQKGGVTPAAAKLVKQRTERYALNDVKNLHYRGVRNPGLTTYAGAGGYAHVLPPEHKRVVR